MHSNLLSTDTCCLVIILGWSIFTARRYAKRGVEINCRFWTTSVSGFATAAILFSDGRFF